MARVCVPVCLSTTLKPPLFASQPRSGWGVRIDSFCWHRGAVCGEKKGFVLMTNRQLNMDPQCKLPVVVNAWSEEWAEFGSWGDIVAATDEWRRRKDALEDVPRVLSVELACEWRDEGAFE